MRYRYLKFFFQDLWVKLVEAQIQERVVLTNSSCGHPALLSKTDWEKRKKKGIDNKLETLKTKTEVNKTVCPSLEGEMKSYLSFWVELEVHCA